MCVFFLLNESGVRGLCVFTLNWFGFERLYEFTTTGIEEGFFECQPLCSIVGVSPSHYYWTFEGTKRKERECTESISELRISLKFSNRQRNRRKENDSLSLILEESSKHALSEK